MAISQTKEAYSLFNSEGQKTSHNRMIQKLSQADVIFFGELHDNTLAHWLELQVLKDLHAKARQITLGMEMFESDDQIVLNEYLKNIIDEKNFLKEAKIWDNYKTDYKPIIEYAKQKSISVIATNVPRRYASLVYKKGLSSLDSLSHESKNWIVPLPLVVNYELPGYKSMIEEMAQHGSGSPENLVASQALKDATMAYFISSNLRNGEIFYHINGAYHTQNYEGIIVYLKKFKPKINIVTVQVVEQTDISALDKVNRSKADYILSLVQDMTKSY